MTTLDYASASQTLGVIGSVLDAIDHGTTDPFSVSPLAADYLTISTTLEQQGYEVQNITLNGDTAVTTLSTTAGPNLISVSLMRTGGQWSIIP